MDPMDPRCDFCLHADAGEAVKASLLAEGKLHLEQCFMGGSHPPDFHLVLCEKRKSYVMDYAKHGYTLVQR